MFHHFDRLPSWATSPCYCKLLHCSKRVTVPRHAGSGHIRSGDDVSMCRTPDGKIADVLPGKDSGFNARTRVHEYGGGESVVGDGAVYWSNFKCAPRCAHLRACHGCVPESWVREHRAALHHQTRVNG